MLSNTAYMHPAVLYYTLSAVTSLMPNSHLHFNAFIFIANARSLQIGLIWIYSREHCTNYQQFQLKQCFLLKRSIMFYYSACLTCYIKTECGWSLQILDFYESVWICYILYMNLLIKAARRRSAEFLLLQWLLFSSNFLIWYRWSGLLLVQFCLFKARWSLGSCFQP